MNVESLPLNELSRRAIAVLTRELGVADTLRFLSQYTSGQGNYTEERKDFLGEGTLEDLIEEARRIDQQRDT